MLITLVVFSGYASGLAHSTTRALLAWSLATAAIVAADTALARRGGTAPSTPSSRKLSALSTRPARRPPGGSSPWLVLVTVAAAWEALAIDTGRRAPHLTVSALALAFRPLEAALYLLWLGAGLVYGLALAHRARPPTSGPAASGSPALARIPPFLVALLLPHSRAYGVAFWILYAASAGATEAAARLSHGKIATAEEALSLLQRNVLARVFVPLAWGYAGWHLFAH